MQDIDNRQDAGPTVRGASHRRNSLLRQQQIYLVQRVPMLALVNIINSTLVAFIFVEYAQFELILAWYAVMLMGGLMQFRGWLKVRNRPVPKVVSGRSLKNAELWCFVMGLAWGLLCFIAFPADSYSHQMFVAVVICGMTAGVSVILAPLPRLTRRFLVAALGCFVIRMCIAGEPIHLVLGAIGTIFCFTMIMGSEWSFDQFEEMVYTSEDLKGAQEHLLRAIESTKDAFAIFGSAGELIVANARFNQWFPGGFDEISQHKGEENFQTESGRWVQGGFQLVEGGGAVSVHTDITELKNRETELSWAITQAEESRAQAEIQRQHAQEADRAKTEFLANMSHELRTPLNAIIGFSEIMKTELMGPIGSDQYKDYAHDIHGSAVHLLSIISDILDLSRIETSNYKLQIEPVEVIPLVDFIVTLCRSQKDGRSRNIDVECDPSINWIQVDQRAIRQILINLTNNALKFTDEARHVGIKTFIADTGEVALQVWDQGIGIPPEKLDLVRQPFYQFESAFQKKYAGSGLGLSICDALVRLHDGRLEIESVLNEGTVVTAFLPADRLMTNGSEQSQPDSGSGSSLETA